jgi:DMSO/TMAO reductase YedYZ molybdopterin-dependent catalytic subunit
MRVRTDPLEILFVTTIYVTNQQPRGFWTDRGYNWFSGI